MHKASIKKLFWTVEHVLLFLFPKSAVSFLTKRPVLALRYFNLKCLKKEKCKVIKIVNSKNV